MSDKERDVIDSEAQELINKCNDYIHGLKNVCECF